MNSPVDEIQAKHKLTEMEKLCNSQPELGKFVRARPKFLWCITVLKDTLPMQLRRNLSLCFSWINCSMLQHTMGIGVPVSCIASVFLNPFLERVGIILHSSFEDS